MLTVEEVVGSVRKLHLMTTTPGDSAYCPPAQAWHRQVHLRRLVRPADREPIAEAPLRLRMSVLRRSALFLIMCSHGEKQRRNAAVPRLMKSATATACPLISKSWNGRW